MRIRLRTMAGVACFAAFGAASVWAWPQTREAAAILAARNDPAALSDARLDMVLRRDPQLLEKEIAAALAADDAELAGSLLALADARGVALAEDTRLRVKAAVAETQSTAYQAERFATGFITGQTDDVASLSGTVAGDLFVYGDLRDLVREGKNLATGEAVDELTVGLAAVGLVVTAGTYVSVGAAAPARAGLSLFKGARRAARVSDDLIAWAGRASRNVVDGNVLRRAVNDASILKPAESARAIKAAVRTDRAGALIAAFKDVGKVGQKAGPRAAMDVMKLADNPKDLARAAKLAESKGGQTRAILKILGRGAIVLAAGALNLTSWLFSGVLFLLGLIASLKAMTERATYAYLRRAKIRRLRAAQAKAEANALSHTATAV